MSRLIDAEDFSRVVKEYMKDCIDNNKYKMDVLDINADIQGLLDKQPTAFDVDKVVEELKTLSQRACNRRNLPFGNKEYERGRVYAFDDAIEIVKEGGIDES